MSEQHETLTKLLTRVIDSADGYEQAASSAKSGVLKGVFEERAKMRRGFASELRTELKKLGKDADDDGSLLAAAHRVFLDLKTLVGGNDNERALEEVERGESDLIEHYEQALKDLPMHGTSRTIVQEQLACVRRDLASAKRLEQAAD